ncbi:alginate export family protein [soil metagenome]
MHRMSRIVFALAAIGFGSLASAQQPSSPPANSPASSPTYSAVRWNEDYSYLKDPARRADPLDGFKYIPLGDDSYLSLGGQVRYRYEYFNNTGFGGGFEDNDGYHLIRVLAHADLHLTEHFRFFLQGKSALIEDGGIGTNGAPRLSDADELDLQQAFADFILRPSVPGDSLTFRVGRRELAYATQRVIGPSDWGNARRTFDGVKVSLVTGQNTLDAFWVRPVDIEKEEFNNGDGRISFAGLFDTLVLPGLIAPGDKRRVDTYALALNRTNARFAQNAASSAAALDEDRYTIGARFSSAPKPFDFEIESAYQFGQFGDGDISAWMIATEAGFTIASQPFSPRLVVGFDYASGDRDPANPDLQTYNQLFPTTHAFFGQADVIGRQNIIDAHGGVELQLLENARYAKKLSLRADQHFFWRADTSDALYATNAGAASAPQSTGISRAAGGSNRAYVGSELDLILSWQMDRHVSGYIGYSHFFADDFIEDTGGGIADRDIDFLYAALVYTF